MGGVDKGLVRLAGAMLLTLVLERLAPQVDATAISANGDPARFAEHGLVVLADDVGNTSGPLAGVLAGLEWAARSGHAWLATAATDTPFFPRDLVRKLASAIDADGADVALASSNERVHPVFGLWPARLAPDLRRALVHEGVRKVEHWTLRHRLAIVTYPVQPFDPFFNINTPQDLAEAERIRREHAP